MVITEQEIQKLKDTKNEIQWNAVCYEIKAARDGAYPPDWWPKMMMSGLIDQISKSWNK